MAVDKVVIQVEGDAKPIEKTIVALERLGKVDAANAKQFETTNQNWAQQFKKRDKEYQAGQDNNAKATEKAGKEVDKTTDKIVNQGKSASFLKNQFASIGATIAGAFAVTQLISFGKEAVNLAAKGEGIRRAFAALNKADLLDNLRAATRNTVADIDLMAAAVKANNFKIPLEDLARYFKFAQQRARETGESVDYLVESIVLGIGRKSPLILDNLGISAVELRSKLKGIGTESATVGQISKAVGQIIDEELSKQGVLLDTTADKIARLDAGWKNIKETIGVSIIDGLIPLYDSLEKTNTEIDRLSVNLGGATEEGGKFNVVSFVLKNIVKGISEPIRVINERLQDMIDIFNKGSENFRKIGVWLGLTDEKIRDLLPGVKDLNQSIGNDFEDATEKSISAQVKLLKAERELTDTQYEAGISTEWLKQRLKDYAEEAEKLAIGSKERNRIIENMTLLQGILDKAYGKTTDKIKEQKKELEKPTKIDDSLGGTLDVTDYEAKADALKQSAQDVADYESELRAEQRKEIKDQTNFEIAEAERAANDKKKIARDEADAKKLIQERLIQATMQLMSMAVEFQLAAKQRETDYELNLLQEQYDARTISEEQYNSKRRAILKDQAQAQKEAAIIQATISTANAVIQAYSESAIAGPVLAAIAAAVGIAQIAAISATPIPQFEKGGKIGGKRHKDGGTFIEAEKDEFVINRKAAQKIGFDNLELLNKGIVPVKLLKQGLMEQRNKSFETSMMKVFGSSDFDTYPIEKELRKSRKHDAELTHLLINKLSKGQQKRGNYA